MATQLREKDELRTVTIERRNDAGDVISTVEVSKEIFGRAPNIPLMHQVVTAQLAARRAGTQSTKTRAEVSGGGAKPYRQKGTGRARQGTVRAPQFAGGGVALGPKPRSYAQKTPRKMTRLALYCALSDRASEGRICLVDSWSFPAPKTKDAAAALSALGLEGNVLVVLGPEDQVAERSFANLPEVDLIDATQLTAYDVLVSDWVVFTDASLPGETTEVDGAKKAPAKKAAAATKAPAKSAASASDETPEDEPEAPAEEELPPAAEAEPAEAASDTTKEDSE
jgi:large subunit ribosomal protein L4